MPAIQAAYSVSVHLGLPGMIVDEVSKTLISHTVGAAGGLAFGIPVMQGTAGKAGHVPATGGTTAESVGISVRDRPVRVEVNQYGQYESAHVMTKGAIWVTAAVQVATGDLVYSMPVISAQTNVATDNVWVAGVRFGTSTTGISRLV